MHLMSYELDVILKQSMQMPIGPILIKDVYKKIVIIESIKADAKK